MQQKKRTLMTTAYPFCFSNPVPIPPVSISPILIHPILGSSPVPIHPVLRTSPVPIPDSPEINPIVPWTSQQLATSLVTREFILKDNDIVNTKKIYYTFFTWLFDENIESLEQLAKIGFNFNIQCKNKKTPLMYAIFHNKKASIVFLLNNGVDLNFQDVQGNTALMYMIMKNFDINIIKRLLEKRPILNIVNHHKLTANEQAIFYGLYHISDIILSYFNLSIKNNVFPTFSLPNLKRRAGE